MKNWYEPIWRWRQKNTKLKSSLNLNLAKFLTSYDMILEHIVISLSKEISVYSNMWTTVLPSNYVFPLELRRSDSSHSAQANSIAGIYVRLMIIISLAYWSQPRNVSMSQKSAASDIITKVSLRFFILCSMMLPAQYILSCQHHWTENDECSDGILGLIWRGGTAYFNSVMCTPIWWQEPCNFNKLHGFSHQIKIKR